MLTTSRSPIKGRIYVNQRQYGRTVSFRYFCDKHLKPRMQEWDGEQLAAYPIYLEIKVRKQTNQRKSKLNAYIPPSRLERYLADHQAIVREETAELQRSIDAHKPFENAAFSLSQALRVVAINVSAKFLLLKPNQLIQEGDEFYSPIDDSWRLIDEVSIGERFSFTRHLPIRRLNPDYNPEEGLNQIRLL